MTTALQFGVTSPDRQPLRIALATAPALLSDALRSLLEGDAEVTVLLADSSERFDVALTTSGAPVVHADLVISLDESPGARGGGTVLGGSTAGRRFDDLDAVLAFVRDAASAT